MKRSSVLRGAGGWTLVASCVVGLTLAAQGRPPRPRADAVSRLTVILGRPTDRSIAVSVLPVADGDVRVEYGTKPGSYAGRTEARAVKSGAPSEFELAGLAPDSRYSYKVLVKPRGSEVYGPAAEGGFHTQRAAGSTFTFALQGDSHPEREGRMFDAALYRRTLEQVRKDQPDFYLLMGDDFSVDPMIGRGQLSQPNVDRLYAEQRHFLDAVARSAPLFLVNGNHEEAARALLKGTADSAPLFSARARNRFFPLPAPDPFYSGDSETVEGIGALRDYYAWTWVMHSSWSLIPIGTPRFPSIPPRWAGRRDPRGDKREAADGKQEAAGGRQEAAGGRPRAPARAKEADVSATGGA